MKQRKSLKPVLLMVLAVIGTVLIARYNLRPLYQSAIDSSENKVTAVHSGTIITKSLTTTFASDQVKAISKQNYGSLTPDPGNKVEKTIVEYTSTDLDGKSIKIHARIYQPVGKTQAPIFAFAPGTVGIGDQCAPSLEQPAKVNWANYESHMMTYAGQGYATVITDYEGMRDPTRIHHYMVGALEGRAVLDSVKALINLDRGTKKLDTDRIFLGGYSQGGHAAFWADQIAKTYAPDLKLSGVVGWGPVTDVAETLTDVTRGANINWFGPYLLTSYMDYYGDNYRPESILLSRWTNNLRTDVLNHCIDSVLNYWGHDPAKVYTPEFIQAMTTGVPGTAFQRFFERMKSNNIGNAASSSAKLINQGGKDNVVLPAQQTPALARICEHATGTAELKIYPDATHYSAMEQSLVDTLRWMKAVREGKQVTNNCSVR